MTDGERDIVIEIDRRTDGQNRNDRRISADGLIDEPTVKHLRLRNTLKGIASYH